MNEVTGKAIQRLIADSASGDVNFTSVQASDVFVSWAKNAILPLQEPIVVQVVKLPIAIINIVGHGSLLHDSFLESFEQCVSLSLRSNESFDPASVTSYIYSTLDNALKSLQFDTPQLVLALKKVDSFIALLGILYAVVNDVRAGCDSVIFSTCTSDVEYADTILIMMNIQEHLHSLLLQVKNERKVVLSDSRKVCVSIRQSTIDALGAMLRATEGKRWLLAHWPGFLRLATSVLNTPTLFPIAYEAVSKRTNAAEQEYVVLSRSYTHQMLDHICGALSKVSAYKVTTVLDVLSVVQTLAALNCHELFSADMSHHIKDVNISSVFDNCSLITSTAGSNSSKPDSAAGTPVMLLFEIFFSRPIVKAITRKAKQDSSDQDNVDVLDYQLELLKVFEVLIGISIEASDSTAARSKHVFRQSVMWLCVLLLEKMSHTQCVVSASLHTLTRSCVDCVTTSFTAVTSSGATDGGHECVQLVDGIPEYNRDLKGMDGDDARRVWLAVISLLTVYVGADENRYHQTTDCQHLHHNLAKLTEYLAGRVCLSATTTDDGHENSFSSVLFEEDAIMCCSEIELFSHLVKWQSNCLLDANSGSEQRSSSDEGRWVELLEMTKSCLVSTGDSSSNSTNSLVVQALSEAVQLISSSSPTI